MLDCPYCSNKSSKVTNKRSSPDGIRRRRECLKCKKRYTTYEKIEKNDFFVIKKDNSRENFSTEKMSRGIKRAFEKRPIQKEKVDSMIREVEETLRKKGKKKIKATTIGELIMKKMKKMDNIAYIRFASVYRDFQDIDDFNKEIKDLK